MASLSVADIDRWSAGAVRDVFSAARARAEITIGASDQLGSLTVFDDWGGDAADAARDAIGQTRRDLDSHGNEALAVARAADAAADGIDRVQDRLRQLRDKAPRMGCRLNAATNMVEIDPSTKLVPSEALINSISLQRELDSILTEANAVDDQLAHAIDMADGTDPIPVMPGSPAQEPVRMQDQIDAFTQVFGREPETAADWETAAMLDPHSYDARNQGVPANVVVGRINPVPGQGLVRGNLFIPSDSVLAPTGTIPDAFDLNAGDNRSFSPGALPENSRVSFLVDYENGLVIARQNPSINLDTGQVRAGTPDMNVAQLPDGSVYLRYAAADPFSPGGETLAKATVAVKGTLAVQPGPSGPAIGGTATAFPALEVYNERTLPANPTTLATTTMAQMYPDIDSQWGPMAGLWRDVKVGDQGLVPQFYGYDTQTPLIPPTTELGSAASPPTVVQLGR